MTDLAQSQMAQTNEELVQLRRANRSTLLTLWLATIFGAIVGGIISTFLARRITKGVDLVAERANAIAAGDLTGDALDLKSQDQIGSLATAMQQMQGKPIQDAITPMGLDFIAGGFADDAAILFVARRPG